MNFFGLRFLRLGSPHCCSNAAGRLGQNSRAGKGLSIIAALTVVHEGKCQYCEITCECNVLTFPRITQRSHRRCVALLQNIWPTSCDDVRISFWLKPPSEARCAVFIATCCSVHHATADELWVPFGHNHRMGLLLMKTPVSQRADHLISVRKFYQSEPAHLFATRFCSRYFNIHLWFMR